MLTCRFKLNGFPLSVLTVGNASYPAFSGYGERTNQAQAQCVVGLGPIPRGTYYIVDRSSGGWRGPLDVLLKKTQWFALYAADGRVNDETFCDSLMRGQFRLHPALGSGRSLGCITLPFFSDFTILRRTLLAATQHEIPDTDKRAYGRVIVT